MPQSLLNLTHLGLISCSGPDAAKFLQGQLTCDIQAITPSKASLGSYCDHKGQVLGSFYIFLYKDSYYISLPFNMVQATLEELKKFAIFSKVLLNDVSTQFWQIGLPGLAEIKELEQFQKIPLDTMAVVVKDNIISICISKDYPRFLLIIPKTEDSLKDTLEKQDVLTADAAENTWNLLDIQQGWARIYPQTRAFFRPHELNFHQLDAVSFTKGCYRGQEIVARMHYLGKLKRHLTQASVRMEQLPLPSTTLWLEEQAVGEVVMAAKESEGHYQLLVVIKEVVKDGGVYLNNLDKHSLVF